MCIILELYSINVPNICYVLNSKEIYLNNLRRWRDKGSMRPGSHAMAVWVGRYNVRFISNISKYDL